MAMVSCLDEPLTGGGSINFVAPSHEAHFFVP
jgi:hypothetical protein